MPGFFELQRVVRYFFAGDDETFRWKDLTKANNSKKTDNDVSEVYSPPRVTEVAEATGLRAGWALDLTVNQDDGVADLALKPLPAASRSLIRLR